MSLLGGPSLSVKLAEPFVCVTAPNRWAASRTNVKPVLIRGLLVLKLPKATKITGIEVIFDGKSTTDWPEGIGPRRLEVAEHIPLVFLRTSFLDSAVTDRRAFSLGPGVRYDEHELHGGNDVSRQISRPQNERDAVVEPGGRTAPLANSQPSRTNVPQRAASAFPGFEYRTLQTRPASVTNTVEPPPNPTPPYTVLAAGSNGYAADTMMLEDRGRSFLRGTRDTPDELQHRNSHQHEYSPGHQADGGSRVLAPEAGVEDHLMPVIPEDPPTVPRSPAPDVAAAPGGATVDVFSTPSTQPPSAAGSLDSLDLRRWPSTSSSTGRSVAEPSRGVNETTLSLPTPLGTGGALHATIQASTNTQSPLTVTQQNSISIVSSPSTNSNSQRHIIPASPFPHQSASARRSLSNTSTERAVDNYRITRTHDVNVNGGDRSPSRGRHGHNSRFSLSSVTSILREVSQDVRDAVGLGQNNYATSSSGSRGRRSGSRTSQGREPRGPAATSSLNRVSPLPEAQGPLSTVTTPPLDPHPESFMRNYGRGGVGSGDREGTRSRTRDSESEGGHPRPSQGFLSRMLDGEDDDESEGRRGRDVTVNPLGDASHFDSEVPPKNEGWKEFRKGTFTYPISLAIPSDLPPSLNCDFGSVSYRLRATVHRAGTFAPKLTSSIDVKLVSCLAPEATDDLDNIIVQRSWEDKLSYVVHVEGTAFPVGGIIPVNVSLMPLDKISLYRITLGIEEKIDYYAHGHKVARHEPVHFHEVIQIRQPDTHQRLLPNLSDSSAAASGSPLAEYVNPERDEPPDLIIPPTASTESLEHTSDVVSHLLNPAGPWYLRFNVRIPDCHSGIHFTNKGRAARIIVTHRLKTTLRVAAGVVEQIDTNQKLKLFDIIIETPIHLLSCQCESSYTHLPTYTQFAAESPSPAQTSDGRSPARPSADANNHHHHLRTPSAGGRVTPNLEPVAGPTRGTGQSHPRRQAHTGGHSHSNMLSFVPTTSSVHMRASPSTDERSRGESSAASRSTADAIQRSEQFARLVAGEESEAGEQPPAYSS